MNLILIFCSFISVFSGIIFFAITGDLLMIFIPGIVNFLGLSIVGIIYKLLVKNEIAFQSIYVGTIKML